MADNHNFDSNALCRLSWFIVEMDEGEVKEGNKNGRKCNEIVHHIQFTDDDPTNKYIQHEVRFNCNRGIVGGHVVMASDDRPSMEKQCKQLLIDRKQAITDNDLLKLHLVLHENGNSSFTLSILYQNEIKRITDEMKTEANNENPAEIIIPDDKALSRVKLLFTHQSDELMQKQLNGLEGLLFNIAYRKPHDNVNIEQNCWLLVQYSKGLHKRIYSVISDKDAIWKLKNSYPNAITYIIENDAIHQAVILCKSLDRNELYKKLKLLKEYCSTREFPIANTMTTTFTLPSLCQNGLSPTHSPSISPTNSDDI